MDKRELTLIGHEEAIKDLSALLIDLRNRVVKLETELKKHKQTTEAHKGFTVL